MKKKNKKNQIRMRFPTILLCSLAILLCTAAYGAHSPDYTVDVGDVLNVGTGKDVEWIENDYLMVKGGTVNLYTGAYVDGGIFAFSGSTVNIYAGELGTGSFIMLMDGESIAASTAVVTVYGTGFAVDWDRDGTADPLGPSETEFTPSPLNGSVLEGTYKDGAPIHLLFLSEVLIHLVNLDAEVEIDIKPGSNLNSINLKSKGVVPVAVFSITDFDAETIDPGTVTFAGAAPERWKLEDLDEDGDLDMLFHFKTEELVDLDENSTEAKLIGKTFDDFGGDDIELTDTVRIVQSKKE